VKPVFFATAEELGTWLEEHHETASERTPERTGVYSSERRQAAVLPAGFEERLRASSAASEWFEARPPGYRKTAIHSVISAKREETRMRRLQQLIDCSAEGRTVPPLTRP
jgi:uncharacterized protein YdeI (YjbR/CyaY-like superfamily)